MSSLNIFVCPCQSHDCNSQYVPQLLLVWVLLLHPDNPPDVGSVTQCAGVTAGGIHLHQAD